MNTKGRYFRFIELLYDLVHGEIILAIRGRRVKPMRRACVVVSVDVVELTSRMSQRGRPTYCRAAGRG